MFVKLNEGDKVIHKDTGETGEITEVRGNEYVVELTNGSSVTFPKVKTLAYNHSASVNQDSKKKSDFREQEAVAEFHKAFNYPRSDSPRLLSKEDIFKRVAFIQEELIELLAASCDNKEEFQEYLALLDDKIEEAVEKEQGKVKVPENPSQRMVAQIDALTDINVFTQGTGDMMGVQLLPFFEIVMKSNMSKLDDNGKPIYNDFGKIKKSNNFIPPEPLIEKELKRQIEADDTNE